jgi:nucleotide-binding universal stress UspA family protein
MFKKILVAIDRSETSKQAFAQAMFLAKATQGSLMLVNVSSPAGLDVGYPNLAFPVPGSAYIPTPTEALQNYLEQWEMMKQQEFELLKADAKAATNAGIATEYTQPLGDPGKEICQLAQQWGANLIVMGRRGRSGLSELIQGSVSNYVTHHAHCSVLTVQGAAEDVGHGSSLEENEC